MYEVVVGGDTDHGGKPRQKSYFYGITAEKPVRETVCNSLLRSPKKSFVLTKICGTTAPYRRDFRY